MSDRFFRAAAASRIVQKLTAKAVLSHGLIEDGDKILIAVSGGKDSTALAWALSSIRREIRKEYSLCAIHISSDFCSCCKKSALRDRLARWDIPCEDLFVPVIARLKPGEKMNCYWCSTQRRAALLSAAQRLGCNKIALGHHLDDILETYFMNMTQAGVLRGMPVHLAYRKYPVTLIRPLALLEERQIISCADENGFLQSACTCPYGRNSNRAALRSRIAAFTGSSSSVKRRLYQALFNAEPALPPVPEA
jgi:tRNA 2-thiocytidine biosynthesis protein TtcA